MPILVKVTFFQVSLMSPFRVFVPTFARWFATLFASLLMWEGMVTSMFYRRVARVSIKDDNL